MFSLLSLPRLVLVLVVLALVACVAPAFAGHPVVVQRVRTTPFRPFVRPVVRQRVVVQPFVHHRAAFVAPVQVQEFAVPVYQQQFVAPVVAQPVYGGSLQLNVGAGCSCLYR